MNILYLIPARGGSKGIPKKNIKPLHGKPLIYYSIDIARQLSSDEHICVSTDDKEIKKIVEVYGLQVPFLRPEELATDNASTNDVILHALDFFRKKGRFYDVVVLLQPTSPLRQVKDVEECLKLYNDSLDMVTSVKKTDISSVLCNEDKDGFLQMTFGHEDVRRQDALDLYVYNGAVYVINAQALLEKGLGGFTKRKKYVMPEINSIDIDTELDWMVVETLLEKQVIKP